MNDLRYGFRQLLKQPGFTAVAVLTLALGIGANTAIFSMANSVLWRPLPFPDPDQLVAIGEGNLYHRTRGGASAGNFSEWSARCRSFSTMAASQTSAFNLSGGGIPERVVGSQVTENYFAMLRVQPILGRSFTRGDFESADRRLALLSYRLWHHRFGGNTEIIGQVIKLNGEPHTIVGVVPEAVEAAQERIDVWTPLVFPPETLQNREARSYAVHARMHPGISLEQARSEMKAIAGGLITDFPSLYSHLEIWVSTLGERFESSREVFAFLLLTVGTILLIACANLASLLLVRAVHRRGEICLRNALGADRLRLIRQLLSESVVLACLGGGMGLLFAKWGFDLLLALFPSKLAGNLPSFIEFHWDWRVLGFAAAISLISGILFGLVPAIESSKVNLVSGLQAGGRDLTGGNRAKRLSQIFVATQVAVCFATVLFTAICFNSLSRFVRIPPGFDATNLLTAGVTLAGSDFSSEAQRISFLEQVVERLQSLPGVRSAGSADTLPFANPRRSQVSVAGHPSKGLGDPVVYAAEVSPDYFRTLGIALLKGRPFTRQDHSRSTRTAIVSESLALELFGKAKSPIGQRILLRGDEREIEIVGVVPNVQQATLGTIRTETKNLYLCQLQSCGSDAMLAIRAAKEPGALATALRRIVSEINPDLPVFAIQTMDELVASDQQLYRYLTWCMAVFSCLALVLAVMGIYGTMAYAVAQRTREFGVRLALGATIPRLLALVTVEGMTPIIAGLLLGIITSVSFVYPVVQALFYNVAEAQPWMFLGVGFLLTGTLGIACLLPAFRAGRVNPMEALRYE